MTECNVHTHPVHPSTQVQPNFARVAWLVLNRILQKNLDINPVIHTMDRQQAKTACIT